MEDNLQDLQIQKKVLRLLIERDGFVCGICKGDIEDVFQANVDHVIPRFHGGKDVSTNLQPAHESCNLAKGHTLPNADTLKPKCSEIDKLLKIKKDFIKSKIIEHHKLKKDIAEKQKEESYDLISDAIQRKKLADEFLESIIAKSDNQKARESQKPRVIPKRIPVVTEKVDSDAPVRLWNELARNQYKNLSYNIFLSFFDEYRKAPSEYIAR